MTRKSTTPRLRLLGLLLMAGIGPLSAQSILRDGFEDQGEIAETPAAASRFLAQATFGATEADIAALQGDRFDEWITAQQQLPPTYLLPYMRAEAGVANPTAPIDFHFLTEAWFDRSLKAPDQLRQRVAFALSEIFVVSERGNNLANDGLALGAYYDILLRNAFGNYRDLLRDTTLSPAMGRFLSMYRNQKPNPALNIRPDENFAREVLQLFSIGLVKLQPDGRPIIVGNATVPTYDEQVVRGFAHAFTGWACPGFAFEEAVACATEQPMAPFEAYHDRGAKSLFDGIVLPAGQDARPDLEAALDAIFEHPNVGPFIGKQLIQRLVTSNPSPEYVGRVSAVFDDNGQGLRGDLGAVVRAILLDPEARLGQSSPRFGKVREPLLRLTQVWRGLNVTWRRNRLFPDDRDIHVTHNQTPLGSPSVFNFFAPSFAPPGPVSANAMVAPELQAITDTVAIALTNDQWGRIHWACNGCPMDLFDDSVRVTQLDSWRTAITPGAGGTVPEAAVDALIARADVLFLGGTMSTTLRQQVRSRVLALPADDPLLRVQNLLYLITASPEYAVQR
jgi:uncharacterized protein (DUF1800 family)